LKNPIVKILLHIFLIALLTVVTQICGAIYLLTLLISCILHRKYPSITVSLLKAILFIVIYGISCFAVIPLIAPFFGRVPLPLTQTDGVKPLNIMTAILNRHYVTLTMRKNILNAGLEVRKRYPGSVINYLDANFPFYNGFPLLPHLSHDDGTKLDLAFFYTENGRRSSKHPSWLGYGACEEPTAEESNTAEVCAKKGYWQYSALKYFSSSWNRRNFEFDAERTKFLLLMLVAKPNIQKVFLEPHLKQRLGLQSNKIRFHGCQAVRHDDHIHIQL
jgi:hypothetical protein